MLVVGRRGRELRTVEAGVAVGDVLGVNIANVVVPNQREIVACRLERSRIDSLSHVLLYRLARIGEEPRLVEVVGRIILGEAPLTVYPHLVPVMIAAIVVPSRSARYARRDAYGAERIGKQDREARARSHVLTHRLVRSLVGLLALRVVVDEQLVAHVLVHRVDSLAHRLARSHILLEALVEVLAPVLARLVQIHVSHHVVQEHAVGHGLCPWKLGTSLVSVLNVLKKEVG